MIEDPPINSSQTTTNDLTSVLLLANNRTENEKSLVYTVDRQPLSLYDDIIQEYGLIFPYQMFFEIYEFLSAIILDIKYYYNRPRPYQLADFYNLPLDVIVTQTHHTPSYPSGHTAYAALAACILSEKYTEYTDLFFKIADRCGKARVLQGVHFPGDNNASISFVTKIYSDLKKFNTMFKRSP